MSNAKQLGSSLERRVVDRARRLGLVARRQPGSGVFADYPNDVEVERLLGECKVRSTRPSLNEMAGWLDGARLNADKLGYEGAFLVYNDKGGRNPLVLLDLDLLLALLASRKRDLTYTKS